ncbi:Glycosyltransferase involved in cell wall bisynthesis [Evansella caseinilytica]|uniref:Glycosyltransferase involved in cell wall bisynthesis n=1 Tax=Evansella caseinilytica TaxID=1503961 RepID=A0A1H3HPK5_9BACI|nr:glycosyltransferase family 4 protein [Evansella caseinilytica]SDY16728.1 Glycosyltransferase involved in cell wall bisynthesis [Evansella caseinilytica]
MKILQLPSGSDISLLTKALRSLGAEATSCSFSSADPYSYLADVRLRLNEYPAEQRKILLQTYFKKAAATYDVFHYHFGKTFFSDASDLKILKESGKKLIVHHRGSEVRKLSVARKNNPYVKVKTKWTEEKIAKQLKRLSTYVDYAIVCDHELKPYIEPYYKKIYVVPRVIDRNKYISAYPQPVGNPVVVHAPTHNEIKGTAHVLAAVERLKKEGWTFQFKLIEGLPHRKALEEYRNATIVIDQLCIGAYANLSMEAMALGKPVICYIRDDLQSKYPGNLPIVNANPDTIYERLKWLLGRPEQWRRLGIRGRRYVRNYHNQDKVAKQLMAIYEKI